MILGPYAPAILRFYIAFTPDYPYLPPIITFISDIFHPLVTPLTTYTYSTGSSNSDTVSATDDERLPPGGFSLRDGFPHWFGRSHNRPNSSTTFPRNVSDSHFNAAEQGNERATTLKEEEIGSSDGSMAVEFPSRPPIMRQHRRLPVFSGRHRLTTMSDVLYYVKSAFDDESALDNLPLEAAGNSGAWKAWRAHRSSSSQGTGFATFEANPKGPEEWNWDGVWKERVRKGIDISISESVLYGNSVAGDDLVCLKASNSDCLLNQDPIRFVSSTQTMIPWKKSRQKHMEPFNEPRVIGGCSFHFPYLMSFSKTCSSSSAFGDDIRVAFGLLFPQYV